MDKPLWIIGCPSYLGGADTELWDTMKLWRRHGIPLRLTPTWAIPHEWQLKCEAIGVEIRLADKPEGLSAMPDLEGATVISYCNGEFLKHAAIFREKHCRVIWVNCMCWIFQAERDHYANHGPFDGYIFQSEFQKSQIFPHLRGYGVTEDKTHVIHGAFDTQSFQFGPRSHAANTEFYIGRLARNDPDKFSSNTWSIYGAVPYAKRRVRLMGWSDKIQEKLGQPPSWAEVLPPCTETAGGFLGSLHAMVPINGGAMENWPRVGLEAMAAGVPIVTQNQWGWREMIVHEKTGFLCNDDQELAYHVARLAYDDDLRQYVAEQAREDLHRRLADPITTGRQWCSLLGHVSTLDAMDDEYVPDTCATRGVYHAA